MKPKAIKAPVPPAGLSAGARALWVRIQSGYQVIDPAGLAILCEGVRSWDRSEAARRIVDRDGCTTKDKYGQVRAHPAAVVERDSRAAFLAALKALRVDIPTGDAEEE